MNSTSRKCKYKLALIRWNRNIFNQQLQDQPLQDQPLQDQPLQDQPLQDQPLQDQQFQNDDIDCNMPLYTGHFNGNMIQSQQHLPQPGIPYAPFITDTNGYQFPLAIYPITKAYAAKEMQGMERGLVTETDWASDGHYIVQKAIEEVNERDRFASPAGSSRLMKGGSGGGGGYSDSGSRDGGSGAREKSCWEMCGFRYDGSPEWNQIAIVMEKTPEET
ncbi:hypothetical protein EV426DRAFT_621023 [Tirmania nivea]|nr:hypothetical protein EV426DRAFT_621023 [Tirmania nivea]